MGDAPADVRIRAYVPSDRPAVRRACFVTGLMGDPIEAQWSDAESFADAFCGYYTDREPESALVAEQDGSVVGYLLGCVDTRRAWNPGLVLGRHILRRGLAFRRGTAAFVWRSFADIAGDAARRELPPSDVFDERWPAHLHIDLLPEARGQGVGGALMRRWLATLRERGIPGCHLETMAENAAAVSFFASCGFTPRGGPKSVPGMRARDGRRLHVQLMVQPLSG